MLFVRSGYSSKDFDINWVNGILSLFSSIILIIPNAARRSANGSLEPVGFSLIPKKPTRLSILSAIDTIMVIGSLGQSSVGPKGA